MLSVTAYEEPRFSILSYVISESGSGECFIVDPHPGLLKALDGGLKIKAVIAGEPTTAAASIRR
ncbi:MAG: hypothetical protein BWY87_01566 [Deltaproteobacteria bacterium ADurb.Bin510]|nr:MAG: hypothetical protein BWY87_01566 [Deltaproteobacteria bacterium ADurb.Bin510]